MRRKYGVAGALLQNKFKGIFDMLKGISPLISPELLKVLDEMGHGDEIVLADANFPSSSIGQRVIRADGIGTAELLAAILPLFPLDQYDPCLLYTSPSPRDRG